MKRTSFFCISIALFICLSGCAGPVGLGKSGGKKHPSASPLDQSPSVTDKIVDTTPGPVRSVLSDGYSIEAMLEAFIQYRSLCAWLDPEHYKQYYKGETRCQLTLYGDHENLSRLFIVETIQIDGDTSYKRYKCELSDEGNIYLRGPYSFTKLLEDTYIKLVNTDVIIEPPQNPDFNMDQIKENYLSAIEDSLREFLDEHIIDNYWGSIFDIYVTGFYEQYQDLAQIVVVVDNAKVIPLALKLSKTNDNMVRATIKFKSIVDLNWMNRGITCGDIQPINEYGTKKLEHIKQNSIINFKLIDDKTTQLNEKAVYLHNTKGRRTAKLIGDSKTTFKYENDLLIYENRDGEIINYTYSLQLDMYGIFVNSMYYKGTHYGLQQDDNGRIDCITDDSGEIVARYDYGADGIAEVLGKDEEGNWVKMNDDNDFIGNINKIRLNGYYYDDETEYYNFKRYYIDSKNSFEFIYDEAMQIFID